MSKLLISSLCLLLTFCSRNKEEVSTFKYTHSASVPLIRTEMQNGLANGRIILYDSSRNIKGIMHVKDNILIGNTYSFYDNGCVSRIVKYINGYETGRRYDFYNNGQLQAITNYLNDKKQGLACTFYPSGGLESKVTYANNQAIGDFLDYYPSPPNRLRKKVQYVIVRGKQWGNGSINYSPSGSIVNLMDQLDIAFNKTDYRMGEDVILTIGVRGPRLKLFKATIADFDSIFNGNDSTAGHTFYGRRHIVQIKVKPVHIGTNFIRGYATDYDSTKATSKEGIYRIKQKNIYFQQKYIVK